MIARTFSCPYKNCKGRIRIEIESENDVINMNEILVRRDKNERLFFGIDSVLPNHPNLNHVILLDTDKIKIKELYTIIAYFLENYNNPNLIVYRTTNGFHIISLNAYPLREYLKICCDLLAYLDRRFVGFLIMDKKATIRISKKEKKENRFRLLYFNEGDYPISKPHLEVFNDLLKLKNRYPEIIKECETFDFGYQYLTYTLPILEKGDNYN